MKPFTCYVINLARSPARYRKIQQQLDGINIEYERVDAIDGHQLSNTDIQRVYDNSHDDRYYKQLNKNEIACYLSHRKAWERIVEDQVRFGIILEDDVIIEPAFSSIIDALAQLPNDWDYLKLAEYPQKRHVLCAHSIAHVERVMFDKVPSRTCAQAVSYEGAKKLLAHSQIFWRPVDIDLQYWWEKDLRVYGIQPYAIQPDICQESDIESNAKRKHATKSKWRKLRNMWQFYWKNRQYRQQQYEYFKQFKGH